MVDNYKEMIFLPGTEKALLRLPDEAKQDIGYGIWMAQIGKKASSAKPLTGHKEFKGAKVFEIVSDVDTDTYRGVYTVEFDEAIYLVDAFQKKSHEGKATPQRDIDRIVGRITDLRKRRATVEGKLEITDLLERRRIRQVEIDAERERKNAIKRK
jgi:phage-related protein